jgi:CRP/FNR family transcriptional regulator, nitrogen oxide reductase regulator
VNSPSSPSEKAALVQRLTVFSDLSPADCSTILSAGYEKHLWPCKTVFSEGDPIEQMMILLSGCVKVTQLGLSGNEVILRLSGIGDLLGTFYPTINCKHSSTAQVIQSATALVWQVAVFERLLDCFPIFRRNTVRALEQNLREIEQRFRELSTESVGPRLSSELVRLSNRFGVNGEREIRISRRELAQLTGTTVYTVSRFLTQWQQLGIVSIRREVVQVCDLSALTQLTLSE